MNECRPGENGLSGCVIAGIVDNVGSRFSPGDEAFGDLRENWGGSAEYACAAQENYR